MIGAILAGGFGKRLKSFSQDTPKGLIQISNGLTILHRQIFDFSVIGIREAYILSGHLGEKIEQAFGSEYLGVRINYLREEKPMGTLFSMRNLLSVRGDEDILLRNGDTISDLNYREFVRYSMSLNHDMVMCVVKMRSPFGIVEFSGTTVTSFIEKPLLDYYINAGIYYIKRKSFDYFRRSYPEKDLEKSAFPEIVKGGNMGIYREDAFWIGIDSEKEVESARKEYEGRTDFDWGYTRKQRNEGKVSVTEIYVKGGERSSMKSVSGSVLRIERGTCIVSGEEKTNCSEGSTVAVGPKFTLEAVGNVKALLIETT